eukprot:scaffold34615_cov180-Amphora_coffeaeformis.AAC.21
MFFGMLCLLICVLHLGEFSSALLYLCFVPGVEYDCEVGDEDLSFLYYTLLRVLRFVRYLCTTLQPSTRTQPDSLVEVDQLDHLLPYTSYPLRTNCTMLTNSSRKSHQAEDFSQSKGSAEATTAMNSFSTRNGTCTEPSSKAIHSISRVVYTSRLSFVLCLCTVATLMSYGAHRLLTKSEKHMAEQHFEGLAERALHEARETTLRKRRGAKSVASVASYAFPDVSTWPNVSIFGFEGIAQSILETAEAVSMGLCPLVKPDELSKFEDFAYNQAFIKINSHYSNTTGLRDFGDGLARGVHGYDAAFQVYRETDGKTNYNSSYDIITPFIMHSAGPPLLMFNLHSMQRFGDIIDELMDCIATFPNQEKEIDPMTDNSFLNHCAILSDMITMYTDKNATPSGPSAYIMQPIYPAHNISVVRAMQGKAVHMTGFVTSAIRWLDVLERLFSTEVSGVDCVVETETQAYTYSVNQGIVTFKGEGHLHDASYAHYGLIIDLFSPGIFTQASAHYTLTLYPNDDLFDVFGTSNPTRGLIGTLCIMFFTSCIFILYDYFVQKELYRKVAITEARRLFVRFISHECRTPINTICIGAGLIQETLSQYTNEYGASITGTTIATQQDCKEGLMEHLRDWSDLVSDVVVNAQCAVNVLGDLLNYDKVENGTLPLDLCIIPIWTLIQRAGSEFRLAAVAKSIRYEVGHSKVVRIDEEKEDNNTMNHNRRHRSSGGIRKAIIGTCDEDTEAPDIRTLPVDTRMQHVIGDPVRVSQVIRSFISNAFEFSENGGEISVHVSWRHHSSRQTASTKPTNFVLEHGEKVNLAQSGYVQIDVKDSGSGFSEKEIEDMFGGGSQFDLDHLQSGQGNGLGLYMSRGIAEQHGGYVKVSSAGVGTGTCFTLVLPLYHVPEALLPDNLKPENHRPDQAKLDTIQEGEDKEEPKAFRILVVDDAKVCRKLLTRLLKTKGHISEEAENGLVAVEMVQQASNEGKPYDTILLDYEMPVMKGPEAAAQIRQMGCRTFIAGLTGNLLPDDVRYFKQQGADCVLPKPLNMNDLESKWEHHGVPCCANCWENLNCRNDETDQ